MSRFVFALLALYQIKVTFSSWADRCPCDPRTQGGRCSCYMCIDRHTNTPNYWSVPTQQRQNNNLEAAIIANQVRKYYARNERCPSIQAAHPNYVWGGTNNNAGPNSPGSGPKPILYQKDAQSQQHAMISMVAMGVRLNTILSNPCPNVGAAHVYGICWYQGNTRSPTSAPTRARRGAVISMPQPAAVVHAKQEPYFAMESVPYAQNSKQNEREYESNYFMLMVVIVFIIMIMFALFCVMYVLMNAFCIAGVYLFGKKVGSSKDDYDNTLQV